VYIHFEKWFWNKDAQTARRKLILGKEIKIIYDNPWFWKVSASKWDPSTSNKKLLLQDNLSQTQVKRSSDVYIKFDEEDNNKFNTDEFGRELRLSDLNTNDEFGRELRLSDLNVTTDEFGRDLDLKRDYEERRIDRINNLIKNFRPINRRLTTNDRNLKSVSNDRRSRSNRRSSSNDRRSNRRPEVEEVLVKEVEEEPIMRPFASISEDIDNLNIPKFEIDYGAPLPVPKINRKIIKKCNVSVPIPVIKKPVNWYDDDTDDDEETNDTDNFLTKVFKQISINDNRPRSPDYPPPNYHLPKNQEEEEFDMYADLELDL